MAIISYDLAFLKSIDKIRKLINLDQAKAIKLYTELKGSIYAGLSDQKKSEAFMGIFENFWYTFRNELAGNSNKIVNFFEKMTLLVDPNLVFPQKVKDDLFKTLVVKALDKTLDQVNYEETPFIMGDLIKPRSRFKRILSFAGTIFNVFCTHGKVSRCCFGFSGFSLYAIFCSASFTFLSNTLE